MNRFSITVFTPTYNRAHSLPQLYESLCGQDCTDFEWIVVDDGSTDGTKRLIDTWKEEGNINIRYYYQENAGKMAAQNFAVDIADSELFVCLDSDDRLSFQAISKCRDFWNNFKGEICGFVTYKDLSNILSKGHIVDILKKAENEFTGKAVHLTDILESGLFGETAIFTRTDILRQNKFPSFQGEKFVTDAYLWEKLDSKYRFGLMPFISQICTYNPDGYSFNYRRLLFANPLGYRAYHNQRIALGLPGKIKSAICYDAISARIGFKGFLKDAASPFLYALMLPAGIAKYILDSLKLKTFGKVC